ncbi:hypothetical protein ACQKMI_10725 [Lysinibacillus sp. NPDC097214]|uniref:hypothetical protein n=1 Tax=Lysinibacillus sp. NPDC097214 TaxID=3390584 RepID=UPI003CFCA7F4
MRNLFMSENKILVREFNLDDMFDLLEIYDKVNVDIDLSKLKGLDGGAIQSYLSSLLIRNLPKTREDIYKMIGDLTGLTVDEVRKKGIKFLIQLVTELFKDLNFKETVEMVFTQEPTE